MCISKSHACNYTYICFNVYVLMYVCVYDRLLTYSGVSGHCFKPNIQILTLDIWSKCRATCMCICVYSYV